MIQCNVCRESPNVSQHYSKHSSLLTDLSLTPSPPTNEPLPAPVSADTDSSDVSKYHDPGQGEGADEDSLDANLSTSTTHRDQSSLGSTEDSLNLPEPGLLSRTVEESLETPQYLQDSELPSLGHQDQFSSTPDPDTDPEAEILYSPHFNTPEPAQDTAASSATTRTCPPATSASLVQAQDTPDLSLAATASSFHHDPEDILNLSSPTSTISMSSKPLSINNNLASSAGAPGLVQDSPSYCSASPVYSIPSPGSAFSIVISRRRESES